MANTTSLAKIGDIQVFKPPLIEDPRGRLLAIQPGPQLPFNIGRVFVVQANAGIIRGNHAHKRCNQYLVCMTGAVEVVCDDGDEKTSFLLDGPSQALWIPPGIWATQTYRHDDSELIVLCDLPFDEGDYLRDYTSFKAYRRAA